eukprot:m.83714 g.83714  ORF g.83714 m.83714 type:complete len:636 (+) comp12132_c0_seq1:187-2094(+)
MRVCLSLYALGDIVARLSMPGSLYWYTGNDVEPMSAFDVSDTPHKALIHTYLFHRGTWMFQATVFSLHAFVAILYLLGICPKVFGPLLWFATMTMHGRQECFHDGSDKYFRNLLLWSCFVDSRKYPRKKEGSGAVDGNSNQKSSFGSKTNPSSSSTMTKLELSVGTVGYLFQIVLMYTGVIALRSRVRSSEWYDGTAVGIALNTSFGTRGIFVADMPWLCEILTYLGMFTEAVVPFLIFIISPRMKYGRMLLILCVWMIHSNIFLMFNLPQWCLFASIAPMLLTPKIVLDCVESALPTVASFLWGGSTAPPRPKSTSDSHNANMMVEGNGITASTSKGNWSTTRQRKAITTEQDDVSESKEGGSVPSTLEKNSTIANAPSKTQPSSVHVTGTSYLGLAGKVIGVLLLSYMCLEWLSTDGQLINSFDNGDIGQSIRFYQGWVMFKQPQRTNGHWFTVHAHAPAVGMDGEGNHKIMVDVNVLETLNTGRIITTTPEEMAAKTSTIPSCTTCLYPSWRYERYLHQQPARKTFNRHGVWPLSRHWCHMMRNMLRDEVRQNKLNVSLPATEDRDKKQFRVLDVDFSQLEVHTVAMGYSVQLPTDSSPSFTKRIRGEEVNVAIRCSTWEEFAVDTPDWVEV